MQLKPGARIDRYTLVAPLGAGAQGAVWKVIDPLDGGVSRALKIVPTSGLSAESYERVRREAQALAANPHPNLIACYGLFEDINAGLLGIALELVDGKPCQEVASDPRMTAAHRSALLLQLAEALAFIHAQKIVHRDLKPENVLVTEDFWGEPRRAGTIKLVDFGIAAQVGNPRPLTQIGGVVGTAPYLAPEAIVPTVAPDAALGYARDLFAYGVLAYELLLDKHPTGLAWDASPIHFVRAYAAAASGKAPWPPLGLPPQWQEPIGRCLAIDSTERPSSGIELLELLRERASSDPTPINEVDPALALTVVAPSISARDLPTEAVRVVDNGAARAPERSTAASFPSRPSSLRNEPAMWDGGVPSAAPPKKRSGKLGLSLLVLLGLGAAGVVVAVRRGALVVPPWVPASLAARLAGDPAPAAPPKPSAVPTGAPSGVPSAVSTAVSSAPGACPATCCGGTACTGAPNNARGCSSGRTCVVGSCDSRIPTNGDWLLRVVGASSNGKEIAPRPEVCLRRSSVRGNEPWSCTPAGSGDPRAARLRITTAELGEGGVDISINRSPKGPPIVGKGVHLGGVGVAALCKGLNFRFTGADHLAYAVTIFLDDAGEGDAGSP